MANEFLPFCPTDTGSNLLTQVEYEAALDRTEGNQPGVASFELVNKALRQGTYVAGQVAELVSNISGLDAEDNDTPDQFLALLNFALRAIPPVVTAYKSGSGTHQIVYNFMVAAANATAGATYTNNGATFAVQSTISGGKVLKMKATGGSPAASGTLTRTSGSGDALITFYAVRAPILISVEMVGGGGGGPGSSTEGGTGGTTSFGSALLSATGGETGTSAGFGGNPGTASLGTGPVGLAVTGSAGGPNGGSAAWASGGAGGTSPFGGSGEGGKGNSNAPGGAGVTNTGSGGGGCGISGSSGRGGGGSGGYVKAFITTILSTYAYAVGAAGAAGTGSVTGAAGGSGVIIVIENYQ